VALLALLASSTSAAVGHHTEHLFEVGHAAYVERYLGRSPHWVAAALPPQAGRLVVYASVEIMIMDSAALEAHPISSAIVQIQQRGRSREEPLEDYVPDPLVSGVKGIDPEQEVLADAVSVALGVVQDTLHRAEHLALELHDGFGIPVRPRSCGQRVRHWIVDRLLFGRRRGRDVVCSADAWPC
jgi:hypothetical protein